MPHPLGIARHRFPLNRRIRAFPSGYPASPTAQTTFDPEAATANSSFGRLEPAGFGLGTIDQVEPFHRSIRVVLFSEAKSSAYPTAQTWFAEVEAASSSVKKSAPAQVAFGVGTGLHTAPFQCKASVSRPVTVGGRPVL